MVVKRGKQSHNYTLYTAKLAKDQPIPLPNPREPNALCVVRKMLYFPFEKLPPELLAYIFKLAEVSSRSTDGFQTLEVGPMNILPFPFLISNVCHRWRQVALDTATLWVDIRIFDVHPRFRIHDLAISLYLERSKSCPIDITFVLTRHSDSSLRDLTGLTQILLHAERWRVLTVVVDDGLEMMRILSLLENLCLPLLETLQMSVVEPWHFLDYHIGRSCIPHETRIFVNGAPRLRTTRLENIPGFVQPAFANLVSVTLIILEGELYSFTRLRQFFVHISRTLIYLRLHLPYFNAIPEQSDRPIKFPVLRYLNIKSAPILFLISAPALENLSLSSYSITELMEVTDNPPFNSLRHLFLSDMDFAGLASKPHFFATFPHLTSFSSVDCDNENQLLRLLSRTFAPGGGLDTRLTDRAPVDTVLPNLHTLTISDMSNWPLVQSILAERLDREGGGISRICVPQGSETIAILHHLHTWLGAKKIELGIRYSDDLDLPFSYVEGEEEWESNRYHFAVYCGLEE